ncbi:ABC transporter substrate-binding protein [Nesterenkonia suensis]
MALATAGGLLLASCAGDDAGGDGGDSGPVADQVLRYGIGGEIPELDAGVAQGNLAVTINSLIHRGLLTWDENGELAPALAAEWEEIDPATFAFTLHEGLTFSDGSPLTSENVRRSYEHYADPDNSAIVVESFSGISDIETPDDTTVIINLEGNDASFLEFVANATAAIVPDQALEGEPNTVGAGPFQIDQVNEGTSTVLTPFEGYYDADSVNLEELELVYYADDTARTNALRSGEVDLIDYVPWEQFQAIEDEDALVLERGSGPLMTLILNIDTVEEFQDPLVRQALAYAISRENVVQGAFEGNAAPIYGLPLMPDEYEGAADFWEYDPDYAKELLAEAGYPDGFSVTLSATAQYSFVQDVGLAVQQDLQDIGLDVTMDLPDWPTYVERTADADFEMGIGSVAPSVQEPSWLSGIVSGPPHYSRSAGYDNEELYNYIQQGLSAESEEEAREAYEKAFAIFEEEAPTVPLTERDQGYAYNQRVEGFTVLPGILTLQSALTLADAEITE